MSGDGDVDGSDLRVAGTWRGGEATALSEEAWEAVAAGFLGCGFRVTLPVRRGAGAALAHAWELAARTARRIGVELDPDAWEGLEEVLVAGGPAAWEGAVVLGGWGYGIGRDWGPPWTRAVTGLPVTRTVRSVRAVPLPWRWTPTGGSPTAGLPTISALEETRAAAHLAEVGAGAGLWTDPAGRLVTSTAGPLLVLREGRWLFPDPETGVVPQWLHSAMAAELGAEPAQLGAHDLTEGGTACLVSPLGDLLLAGGAHGEQSATERAGELVAARDRVMPDG